MDVKINKVIALVGDSSHDIENVHLISKKVSIQPLFWWFEQ